MSIDNCVQLPFKQHSILSCAIKHEAGQFLFFSFSLLHTHARARTHSDRCILLAVDLPFMAGRVFFFFFMPTNKSYTWMLELALTLLPHSRIPFGAA